jgi:hypothetical protein
MDYTDKYIKYKKKYLMLKNSMVGGKPKPLPLPTISEIIAGYNKLQGRYESNWENTEISYVFNNKEYNICFFDYQRLSQWLETNTLQVPPQHSSKFYNGIWAIKYDYRIFDTITYSTISKWINKFDIDKKLKKIKIMNKPYILFEDIDPIKKGITIIPETYGYTNITYGENGIVNNLICFMSTGGREKDYIFIHTEEEFKLLKAHLIEISNDLNERHQKIVGYSIDKIENKENIIIDKEEDDRQTAAELIKKEEERKQKEEQAKKEMAEKEEARRKQLAESEFGFGEAL